MGLAITAQARMIEEHYFRVDLPDGWTEIHGTEPDRFVYRNATEQRQLIVSGFDLAKPMDQAAFDHFVELRLRAERKELDSMDDIKLDAVERGAAAQRVVFSVAQEGKSRFANGAIVAIPTRVVVFYLESISGSKESHEREARTILESTQIR